MDKARIREVLEEEGYGPSLTDRENLIFYSKSRGRNVQAICLLYAESGRTDDDTFGALRDMPSKDELLAYKQQTVDGYKSRGFEDAEILLLIVTDTPELVKNPAQSFHKCWILDTWNERLIVYEEQINDFFGLREIIERMLSDEIAGRTPAGKVRRFLHSSNPYITLLLAVVNTVLFVICAFTGSVLYNKGDFSAAYFVDGSGIYRMITSMFLHINSAHLAGNMILLIVAGSMVEKYCGHLKYFILYMVSGIAGNLVSAGYEFATDSFYNSVGASGAVMGLIGALAAILILNKGRYRELTLSKIFFMIAYILYNGLLATSVNNAAHIGGVLGGFLCMMVLGLTGVHRNDRAKTA